MPTPSDKAVSLFAELAAAELGLGLDYRQAREAATQVLHMHFLKEHCAALKPETADESKAPVTPAEPEGATPGKCGRPRTRPVAKLRPIRED